MNVGLLNMSSEKFGDGATGEMIVTYIIAAICILMVGKWLKKCWNRRQERQQDLICNLTQGDHQRMANLAQGGHQPMAMQQILAQQLALPAPVPVIVHHNQFKPAILEGTEVDRMEKYRT